MSAMLSVHPVGLNDEAQKILSVTMNVLLAGGCGVRLTDQVSGETVVIVDIDSEEGRSFYEHDHSQHRAVVISGDERSVGADALIRKPLRVQALRNLLSELFEGEGERPGDSPVEAGSNSATTSNRPNTSLEAIGAAVGATSASVTTSSLPNTSLFHAMVNATARGELLRVTAAGVAHPVLLHGPSRHLYTHLNRAEMVRLAELNGSSITVVAMDEFAYMKECRGLESYRFERLIWLAEQGAAAGDAVMAGNIKSVFHLSEWPRFDIKLIKPEYLSMAAIMTRRTLSCSGLARVAGVAPESAYEFYLAAKACGVVEEKIVQAQVEEPVATPPKKTSLVSRIAKKLGISLV